MPMMQHSPGNDTISRRDQRRKRNRRRLLGALLLFWALPLFGWLALPRDPAATLHGAPEPYRAQSERDRSEDLEEWSQLASRQALNDLLFGSTANLQTNDLAAWLGTDLQSGGGSSLTGWSYGPDTNGAFTKGSAGMDLLGAAHTHSLGLGMVSLGSGSIIGEPNHHSSDLIAGDRGLLSTNGSNEAAPEDPNSVRDDLIVLAPPLPYPGASNDSTGQPTVVGDRPFNTTVASEMPEPSSVTLVCIALIVLSRACRRHSARAQGMSPE
jgi:hypothetical protein